MTRAQKILQVAMKYNQTDDLLLNAYNISSTEEFDAVIVAPTWTPHRIGGFPSEAITNRKEGVSLTNVQQNGRQPMMKKLNESYVVEWDGLRLAWLKTGTCAGNVIDSTIFLSNIKTNRLIFLGAAGGLVPDVALSETTTPSCCIDYLGATRYFSDSLECSGFGSITYPKNFRFIEHVREIANQQKVGLTMRRVFCTDTIVGEYLHMNEIHNSGAEVIEMETAAFYRAAELMEIPAIAFLVISDNSSLGGSLSAPKVEAQCLYNQTIKENIPKLIRIACQTQL